MPSWLSSLRRWRWFSLPLLAVSLFAMAHATGVYDYRVVRGQVYTPPGWPEALKGDLYLPERAGPAPVILLVHGGSWRSGSRDELDISRIARHLAAHGYAVFSADYRLAPQYRYPAPIEDLQQALAWLRSHAAAYQLDSDDIGAWGYSAGAHLVAMLGTDANPQTHLRAVVAGGTPADLRRWPDSPIVKVFLGQNAGENMALATEASPISHVSADDPPFFLYHGARDTLVEPEQSRLFAEALRARSVDVEVCYVSGFGHILTALFPGGAMDEGIRFLDTHMMPVARAASASNASPHPVGGL